MDHLDASYQIEGMSVDHHNPSYEQYQAVYLFKILLPCLDVFFHSKGDQGCIQGIQNNPTFTKVKHFIMLYPILVPVFNLLGSKHPFLEGKELTSKILAPS